MFNRSLSPPVPVWNTVHPGDAASRSLAPYRGYSLSSAFPNYDAHTSVSAGFIPPCILLAAQPSCPLPASKSLEGRAPALSPCVAFLHRSARCLAYSAFHRCSSNEKSNTKIVQRALLFFKSSWKATEELPDADKLFSVTQTLIDCLLP